MKEGLKVVVLDSIVNSSTKTSKAYHFSDTQNCQYIHNMASRTRVINLYKTLVHLGRDYPLGWDYFRPRLKTAFMKNRDVTDPEKIEELIARGNYVVKEIETLYMLRKYRTLKKRYYSEEDSSISELTKKIESHV